MRKPFYALLAIHQPVRLASMTSVSGGETARADHVATVDDAAVRAAERFLAACAGVDAAEAKCI
jgi:hypothetical protein